VKIDFRKLYERYGKPKTQKGKNVKPKAIKNLNVLGKAQTKT